jgi:hypothetical protein
MTTEGPGEVTGYRNDGAGTAAALVNAVTTAEGDPSDQALGALLARYNFLVAEVTPRQGRGLREWAEALRPVFTAASVPAAVQTVNGLLAAASLQPHISDHGLGPHLHYGRPGAGLVDRVRANTAMGLAFLVCGYGLQRLGICAAPGCERAYVDASTSARRRYCSTACLNRTTVASFRARRRPAGPPGADTAGG